MNIIIAKKNRGFGLKELTFAIVAFAIVAHFYGPTLRNMAKDTEAELSNTKDGVTSIFRRHF